MSHFTVITLNLHKSVTDIAQIIILLTDYCPDGGHFAAEKKKNYLTQKKHNGVTAAIYHT